VIRRCRSPTARAGELGSQFGDGGPDGGGKRAGGSFQLLPNLGILQGRRNRIFDLIPDSEQSPQRIFDLFLRRSVFGRHSSVGGFESIAEAAKILLKDVPGITWLICRRIVIMRLHLLDGTYELFRSHFGRKDTVTAPDGHDIHATLGILESTLALLREPGVTHLAASFDTVIESFRNEMFPMYKSSAGMDQELLRQFPFAEEALEAIGVVVWRNIEYEADDALAAAAIKWVDDVEQVVICSPDKDMSQVVVGDRIVTYNRREQKIIGEDGVVDKFGIHPESIPDYLALVGDTADGVPGLPGWGAKSASTVLAKFPRLELIPSESADWGLTVRGAPKLAATLAAFQEEVYLYRDLTTLRLDAPIDETLDELEWKGVPKGQFHYFCTTMGFDAAAINVHRWAE